MFGVVFRGKRKIEVLIKFEVGIDDKISVIFFFGEVKNDDISLLRKRGRKKNVKNGSEDLLKSMEEEVNVKKFKVDDVLIVFSVVLIREVKIKKVRGDNLVKDNV